MDPITEQQREMLNRIIARRTKITLFQHEQYLGIKFADHRSRTVYLNKKGKLLQKKKEVK